MAAETDGINIPVRIDDSNLKTGINNSLETINHFADEVKKIIDKAGKEAVFKMNKKDLDKDIKEIQKELETISKTKNSVSIRMTNTFDKSQKDEMQKHFDFLENRAKKLQEKLNFRLEVKESGKTSLKDAEKKIKDINEQINKKRQLQIKNDSAEVFKKAEDDIKNLEKELKELEKTREIKVEMNEIKANKTKKTIDLLKKASISVAAGITAVTGALAVSTKQAIDFETQFAEVKTLIGDMPAEGVDKLKQGIIDLSKETGILSGESIPALYNAISASVPPENAIEFLQVASKNAIGGVTDLGTSVDGLTSILNAYAMDISEAGNVSDLMFETMKRGKTTIGELSSSYFNVIPTAAAVGVQFRDISAAMATITAQGTPTSVATTQLRQVLVELSSDSGKVAETFKKISGQSFREFIASGKNTQDALKLLEKEAKRSGKTINNLFSSVEAGNAALALTGANTERFTNDLEAMNNALGATDEAFQKIDETPAQRIKKIQATLQAVSLEIGNALLPTAEKLIAIVEKNKDGISRFVLSVGKIFTTIANHGKIAVSILSGLAAGFIALNVALAITSPAAFGVAGGIGAITAAFTSLNIATGGIILIIGLVAAALVALVTNLDWVSDKLEKFNALLGSTEAKMKQTAKYADKLAESYKDTAKEMETNRIEGDKLIETYSKLYKKQNRTAEENKKLEESIKGINEVFPTLLEAIDKANGDIEKVGTGHFIPINNKKLSEEAKKLVIARKQALDEAEKNFQEKEKNASYTYYYDDIWNGGQKIDETKNKMMQEEADKALKAYNKALEAYNKARKEEYKITGQGEATKNILLGKNIEKQNEYNEAVKQGAEADKDKLKELEERYKLQKQLINKTVEDEEKKNEELKELDKEYYSKKLNLAEELYINLNKEGKNQTEAEKTYLNKLVKIVAESKNKLDALNKKKKEEDNITRIEKEYEANKKIISNTIDDEKEKNQMLLENEKKYLNDRLQEQKRKVREILLLSQEEQDARAEELDALYKDIADTEARLSNFKDKTISEALAENWQSILGHAQNAINSIANIWSAMWDNNLQKVQDSLDKQLKAIEDNLDKQTKAYEKQMEDLKKAEEDREKNIEKIRERITELNEELGEHETEEVYLKYQEQREALENKLEEEQQALEANRQAQEEAEEQQRIREEEAQLAKEEAERQAAIKKAQLQRKQAIMDKATGIFNATVALASSIAQATAAGSAFPPVLVPLYVGLVTAAAAGQIGAIAMTPLPEIPSFSSGGYVPSSNEQYFKNLIGSSPNNTDKTLVWASQGERILNHNETKQYEYIQSRQSKNNVNNNNPIINISGITVNAGNTKDAGKIGKLSGRAIAKEVVLAISRGY